MTVTLYLKHPKGEIKKIPEGEGEYKHLPRKGEEMILGHRLFLVEAVVHTEDMDEVHLLLRKVESHHNRFASWIKSLGRG
ncbi:unnamed protein product [marine sediment metagenome]|uniref:Uncharacterized protein n=1 Tax=marine sediment metagenome TaxID=412755 RepID=X0ZIR7_9ZZZZ